MYLRMYTVITITMLALILLLPFSIHAQMIGNTNSSNPVVDSGDSLAVTQDGPNDWMWILLPILAIPVLYYLFKDFGKDRDDTTPEISEWMGGGRRDRRNYNYARSKGGMARKTVAKDKKMIKRKLVKRKTKNTSK